MREGGSATRWGKWRLLAVTALACALVTPAARADLAALPEAGTAVADGPVYAIAGTGDRTFIGGAFSHVGPRTGPGAQLAAADGALRGGLPEIAGGKVDAVVADGAGGWFVGGSFTAISDQPRRRLAHIRPDGTLDPWNPAPDGDVHALAIGDSGGRRTLYVGGAFNRVRVQADAPTAARPRLAAFGLDAPGSDVGPGAGWSPAIADKDGKPTDVATIAVADVAIDVVGTTTSMPLVFVGGTFNQAGAGATVTKGLVAFWGPGAKGPTGDDTSAKLAANLDTAAPTSAPVFTALALGGHADTPATPTGERHEVLTLYVGGKLEDTPGVGGSVTALKVDVVAAGAPTAAGTVSGALYTTSWDAQLGALPDALTTSASAVYVGGSFQAASDGASSAVTTMGVAAYKGLAQPAGNGEPATQLPGFKHPSATGVHALAVQDGRLYVGGEFDTMAKVAGRQRLAALDAATGALINDFDPRLAGGGVTALAATADGVYAGGDFTSANALPRAGLAAIDGAGAVVSGWDAPVTGIVRALTVAGARLYVGGQFTDIGSSHAPRTSLAAVDAGTGAVSDWAPELQSTCSASGCVAPPLAVLALATDGNSVYVGGQFTRAGGADRHNLAALDSASSAATDWNPGADGLVDAVLPACGAVYVAGGFTRLGGADRLRLGALDPGTGAATTFAPDANSAVYALALGHGVLYAGGQFSQIGGEPRARLAALDMRTGAASGFNPSADGTVRALAYAGDTLFAGGDFLQIGADERARLAAISPATGQAGAWTPAPDDAVRALSAASGALAVGGTFSELTTRMQGGLAAFALPDAASDAACPDPPAPPAAASPPPPPPPPPPADPPVEDEPAVAPSSYTPPPRKPIKHYPPPRDRDAPAFGLRIHGHTIVLGRSAVGLRYLVSEPGKIHVFFDRRGLVRCPVLVRQKHPGRRCYRYVRRAALARRVKAGAGALTLDGTVGGTALLPGRYRVSVAATDRTGNYSRAVRMYLLVLR